MTSRQCLTLLLAAAMLVAIDVHRASAVVFVSGDGDIVDHLGSPGPIDAGNQLLFKNALQGGTSVAVLRNTYPGCCESFDEEISAFYNSLPGVSATTIIGTVTSANLSGMNLFLSAIPDDAFTASEITALNNFRTSGGGIFFLGENRSFPAYNGYINSALSAMGIGMSIGVGTEEREYVTVTGADITASGFTTGVTAFTYAAPSTVVGGVTLVKNVNHLPILAVDVNVPEPGSAALAALTMAMLSARAPRCRRGFTQRRG